MIAALTGVERIQNILQRKPVDRIGVFEHFWGDTHKYWSSQGHLPEDTPLERHFDLDMMICWPFNNVANLDKEPEVLEETDATRLVRDGNGAVLRFWKERDGTPEHVDFLVQDRQGWEEHIKPFLKPDPRRINFEAYRTVRNLAREDNRFFAWSGVNAFEMMHPVCGHQYMLMGMAIDPDWVKEMAMAYGELCINLMETLFEQEGYPDGVWFYEDMGFKGRPFMSLDMYREILQPAHKRTIEYCHGKGLPVIMHSCGFVEPLIPGMMESGIDCLQVIEVKAGMDLLKLYREYGDRLSLMGGIDVRCLYSNDRAVIAQELETKIPEVKGQFGYVLHSDHSIPNQVEYDSYRFFVERGLELGAYQ